MLSQAKPFAVGLNCALGAADMKPYIDNLSKCADCYVFAYPNAGLPNAMGGYDQKGDEMAAGMDGTRIAVVHGVVKLLEFTQQCDCDVSASWRAPC